MLGDITKVGKAALHYMQVKREMSFFTVGVGKNVPIMVSLN